MRVKKNDNRGFTLVELIVSMAILGIIAAGAGAFMVAGTRAYSSMNYTVRLQYEAQLVMAQLQERIVDCSAGVAWDPAESTLYIVNNGVDEVEEEEEEEEGGEGGAGEVVGAAAKTVHIFTYTPAPDPDPEADPEEAAPVAATPVGEPRTITYGTGRAAETLNVAATALCAKHVDSMNVKLKETETSSWAEITLKMSNGNKTYTATQVVSLRNRPVQADSWDELWDEMN